MYEGEIARSILISKSRVLEQFRQAVASILKKLVVFHSQVKRDGKYYLYVIVDDTERCVFLNELNKLGPCEMDVMLQC